MKKRNRGGRRGRRPRADSASDEFFPWIVKVSGWDGGGHSVPPIRVGELLREEFMKPLGVTPQILGAAIPRHPDFPDSDITEAIRDVLRADDDSLLDMYLSLALDRYFGMSSGFFWRAQAEQEVCDAVVRERPWLARVGKFGNSKFKSFPTRSKRKYR